jgi:hypothetical protein
MIVHPLIGSPDWLRDTRRGPWRGDLYRRSANGVLMQCITQEEGCELLTEVHVGECGNHASSCVLVGKAFQHGFYRLTALQDAIEMVKTYRACQFHAK